MSWREWAGVAVVMVILVLAAAVWALTLPDPVVLVVS